MKLGYLGFGLLNNFRINAKRWRTALATWSGCAEGEGHTRELEEKNGFLGDVGSFNTFFRMGRLTDGLSLTFFLAPKLSECHTEFTPPSNIGVGNTIFFPSSLLECLIAVKIIKKTLTCSSVRFIFFQTGMLPFDNQPSFSISGMSDYSCYESWIFNIKQALCVANDEYWFFENEEILGQKKYALLKRTLNN